MSTGIFKVVDAVQAIGTAAAASDVQVKQLTADLGSATSAGAGLEKVLAAVANTVSGMSGGSGATGSQMGSQSGPDPGGNTTGGMTGSGGRGGTPQAGGGAGGTNTGTGTMWGTVNINPLWAGELIMELKALQGRR